MKDYRDILELEQQILSGTYKARNVLWSGAGQDVTVTSHKDAYLISTLIYDLKEIIPYDYLDKYELFGRLLENLPKDNACREIIRRAKVLYGERTHKILKLVPS